MSGARQRVIVEEQRRAGGAGHCEDPAAERRNPSARLLIEGSNCGGEALGREPWRGQHARHEIRLLAQRFASESRTERVFSASIST